MTAKPTKDDTVASTRPGLGRVTIRPVRCTDHAERLAELGRVLVKIIDAPRSEEYGDD